jgi:hypothetical protein
MAKSFKPKQNAGQPKSANPEQTQPAAARPTQPTRPTPTRTAATTAAVAKQAGAFGKRGETLVFGREQYKWMLIGIAIIAVGLLCMAGGRMPNNDTWDPNIIYSTRITVIAPILILTGLMVEIYAIFKK